MYSFANLLKKTTKANGFLTLCLLAEKLGVLRFKERLPCRLL